MLKQAELTQVRDYVIKILPELLRTQPEIATTIEGILAQHFPRRDEFARMLDELQDFRRETDQRFQRTETELREFRQETDQRFQRTETELHEFRTETIERFEQVDQRFEQVDKRFEQVDKRFDGIDRTLLLMKRDIVQVKSGQETILKRMDGMENWIQFVTGVVRNEKGAALEEVVAAALRYKLQNLDIVAENVYLRRKLVDHQGTVFGKDFETEVDVIAENGDLLVFEVKSTGRASDVSLFALKVNLVREQNPQKRVRGLFIAPLATPEMREKCEQYGLQLLS